jgi:hypothetical protein
MGQDDVAAGEDAPAEPEPTVEELLRRVDAGWAALQESVGRLSPSTLEETVGGWTRKQLLAHIAGWHRLTTQRLTSYQQTGAVPPSVGDADELNAGFSAESVDRPATAVLAEVESTFAELRVVIARLRDEDLTKDDWWPLAITMGNTAGHYEEHLPELAVD